MSKLNARIAAITLPALVLPLAFFVQPAAAACVSNVASWDMLWMRAGPSARSPRVGGIGPNACGVRVIWRSCARGGRWCKVRYRGRAGWVNMRYIDEGGDEAGMVRSNACVVNVARGDVLWMRSGPSARYRRVASLPPGYCGVIVRNLCRSNWCLVHSLDGAGGWVNMRYIGFR